MNFAHTLKAIMDERGITATEISNASGVGKPYLSQLLNGKMNDPTWSKACAIIDALGMSLDDFRHEGKKDSAKNFAATLCGVMKEKGLTASDLVESTGFTKQYISALLNGKMKSPTLDRAIVIVHALDMSLDEFLDYPEGSRD